MFNIVLKKQLLRNKNITTRWKFEVAYKLFGDYQIQSLIRKRYSGIELYDLKSILSSQNTILD